VDTYDNTFLANEIFPETYTKLEKTAATVAATFIKKACERFKIAPSEVVEKLASDKVSTNLYVEPVSSCERTFLASLQPEVSYYIQEKTASAESLSMDCFADVERICDNYTHAQYVFRSPTHVKVACKWFEEKHEKMPIELRHKYATAIQTRSEELGMGQQKGTIAKYAGDAYGGQIEGHLSSRRRLLDGSKYAEEFGKLASARKDLTPYQFAQLLHAFDKKAGLNRYYDNYLKDPFQATFASSNPASYSWMSKKSSRTLTSEEIEKVINTKHEKIAEYFGKGIAAELKKDPVPIFDSMPNDVKEVIANIHDGLL
jgi:hypothetical protein